MNPEAVANLIYREWNPAAEREKASREAEALWEQYPKDPDTSLMQLTEHMDGGLVSCTQERLWCFDGERVVGVVAYDEITEIDPPYIFIYTFAVIPSHQRRGIGTALLKHVQDVARGQLPIIVRGVNDVAIPRLFAVGFQEIPGFKRNRRFKWSDLTEYQNDWTPWPANQD